MKIWIVGKMIYFIAGISLSRIPALTAYKRAWRGFVGYAKRIRETSFTSHFEIGLHIYGVVNHTIYMQEYRSGHNEAVLKNSRYCHCKVVKTLDFIGFFTTEYALCEKRFSQFSRNFPWLGLRFLIKLNTRRVFEVVITRRSWNPIVKTSLGVRITLLYWTIHIFVV